MLNEVYKTERWLEDLANNESISVNNTVSNLNDLIRKIDK